jgi:lipopolysaccharide export system permease protein
MGQRIFLGAVVGAGFFLLTRTMSYVAVIYQINPALTAMLPAAIFITLTVLLNRRVR